MATEVIGWAAALILLATISSQVYAQWRTRSTTGVSPWLFAGQVFASIGFTVYSALLGNAVFTVTNALMLASAVVGQLLFWRNQRKAPKVVESLARSAGVPITSQKRKPRRSEAAPSAAPSSRRKARTTKT